MPDFLREQLRRDLDPATPPWLTVRMYLTLSGLGAAIAALVMLHG